MTGTRNLRHTRPWVYLLLFGALLAAGCSTSASNSGANLVDAQGNHPAGWISTHPTFAGLGGEACKSCHGEDLQGGISGVSCFTASFNGQACHAGGPTRHPLGAGWRDPTAGGIGFHGTQAKADLAVCQGCHGTPGTTLFNGGVAPTSCAGCHADARSHPTDWQGIRTIGPVTPPPAAATITHRTAGNINVACAICHLVTGPGAGPLPGAPSCFSANFTNALVQTRACHPSGPSAANHVVPFFDNTHFQATQATFDAACSGCHAITGTSPVTAAPVCQVCHTAGSPLTLSGCTSCHANPPAGAAYPNISGAHVTHLALNNGARTPVACDTCHNGLGTNTLNHYNRANARPGLNALRVPPGDAAFPATYNAVTGASSFDNATLSCSNVSCHGGQARSGGTPGTPLNWQTGTLDVNTQCTNCHAFGTVQFNSYNSGQHNQGNHVAFGCLICHNTTTLAGNHFTALSTPTMEGPASATIGGAGTVVSTYVPGATPGTGSCTPSNINACHNTRTW